MSSRSRQVNGAGRGLGVDYMGGPVVDPSENVKALNDAAVRRIDDMAALFDRLTDEKIRRMEREAILRDQISQLSREHSKELRMLEADRLDKIRQVDVSNAAATAQQLLGAVQTLASTAQTTAETLRNQVAATAAAVASQTERVVNPIVERIALLERASYTGVGKGEGKSEGLSLGAAVLMGTVSIIGVLVGIAVALYTALQP